MMVVSQFMHKDRAGIVFALGVLFTLSVVFI